MAESVGKRRDANPAILMVDAEKASNDGISFYIGNDEVWLCDHVPSKYLQLLK